MPPPILNPPSPPIQTEFIGPDKKVVWPWLQWLLSLQRGVVWPFSITGLPAYASNALAVADGLTPGRLYRTGGDPDLVAVVH